MRHHHVRLLISQELKPATFWLVTCEGSFGVDKGQKGHEAENLQYYDPEIEGFW